MKKFVAFLLCFCLLFTLAIPGAAVCGGYAAAVQAYRDSIAPTEAAAAAKAAKTVKVCPKTCPTTAAVQAANCLHARQLAENAAYEKAVKDYQKSVIAREAAYAEAVKQYQACVIQREANYAAALGSCPKACKPVC